MSKPTYNYKKRTSSVESKAYSDLGYISEPFPYTTPAFLEAQGKLLGLTPPSATNAKVLELGGSYGGNSISQAFYNKDAHFTVIDFSKEHIEKGNQLIQELHLHNVELLLHDISELPDSLGTFDYIIAHGVYSWVDDTTKDMLLNIISTHLAPNGMAYISYNTYPGWHIMDQVRELMLFSNTPHPNAPHDIQVQRAKYVSSIIGSNILQFDDLKERNKKFLNAIRKTISQPDYYVGHDHLEPHNDPVYFRDMIYHLNKHQLAYVCDADLTLSCLDRVEPSIYETLLKLAPSNRWEQEQYADFILDTPFRKSIIVKDTPMNKSILDNFKGAQSIPVDRLEEFHFQLLFDKDVITCWEEDFVKEAFLHVVERENSFTLHDLVEYVSHNSSLDHYLPSNSDCQLDILKETLGNTILEHIVKGGIRFYLTPIEQVKYEEGNVFVPSELTNFAIAFVLGNGQGHAIIGTPYNEGAPYLNSIDIEIMSLLKEPKSEKDVIRNLQSIPIYDTTNGTNTPLTPEEYLPIGLSHIEQLGAFRRKI